jgi:LysM repeat protein
MSVRAIRGFSSTSFRRAAFAVVAISIVRSAQLVAQEATQPKTHTVKRGDTLWDLAKTYLGDSFLWPEIYRLNTDVVQDPHWIYPGEVLKLPGEVTKAVAAAPEPVVPEPTTPTVPVPIATPPAAPSSPTIFAQAPAVEVVASPPSRSYVQAEPAVRFGEALAAPWVDQPGGPHDWGKIIRPADLSVHELAEEGVAFSLFDDVLFAPPHGAMFTPHTRYLVYVLGPYYEDFGQIVIPTGVVEVIRSPANGDAGVARIMKMFTHMEPNQRLMPLDTSAMSVAGFPSAVTNGHTGTVRWLYSQPLLPSIQQYLVIDIARAQGIVAGDRIELYQARQRPLEEGELGMPEISVGRAQIVKVTPFGATAVINAVRQPKIQPGTSARITAKMP